MKFGLSEQDCQKISEILKKYPEIEKAILYGSRAIGNFKPASDIDLTLVGTQLNLNPLTLIASDLDDLLLPYTMDLSIYATLNHPDLLEHIRRNGVDFYVKS